MNAVPGCEAMALSVVMFVSLSGVHAMPGLIGLAGAPSGRGEDCVSHIAIPNQKAGCSSKVKDCARGGTPVGATGSVGSVRTDCIRLPRSEEHTAGIQAPCN